MGITEMNWLTTSTLLTRLHDFQDDDAWSRAVNALRPPILHLALSMGLDQCNAEDVAQSTLVAFARRYQQGLYDRSRGRLSRWVFGISFREILAARRKLAQQELLMPLDSVFLSLLTERRSAAEVWQQVHEQTFLQQCLDRIQSEVEPKTFAVFIRLVLESVSPAIVASEFDMSVGAVYKTKHRILCRMRELATDGITQP